MKDYVRSDDHGALRVGSTRVSLDSVVIAFQHAHSPETIQQQYPALTLEEVYGAITYYLAHKEEVHEYLKRQDELWQRLRDENNRNPSPVIERLRQLRKSQAPAQ
jgi:uncharacterized protein (DUF433 family)